MTFFESLLQSRVFKCLKSRIGFDYPLYPRGHFHSTIPQISKVYEPLNEIQDIDFNNSGQLKLMESLASYYASFPFGLKPNADISFSLNNTYFTNSDAVILYCFMVQFRPSTIIEIGSGHSTLCMLDTIKTVKMDCQVTAIDINLENLHALFKDNTLPSHLDLVNKDVRQVDTNTFKKLQTGDILFIDSSHVSKYQSDLNYIMFEILPILEAGVIIHFHDVFDGFEYPEEWLKEGIYWNEQYLLRAFLQNNENYQIIYFSDYLEKRYYDWYKKNMPLCLDPHERRLCGPQKGTLIENIRGQSLWLRKLS